MPGKVLKGFEGFLHQAGGSCAVSHPQALRALSSPLLPDGNSQTRHPKLERGELGTWAASSPRPGPGSAQAKRLVFPGLGVLGWPVPRVPTAVGGRGRSRTLSPSSASLLLRFKLGGDKPQFWFCLIPTRLLLVFRLRELFLRVLCDLGSVTPTLRYPNLPMRQAVPSLERCPFRGAGGSVPTARPAAAAHRGLPAPRRA